ncbi:hypothetical protein [Sulfurimonas sp.]|uniref:hypothetical protein n=1 Tax=Sulfurimonas sp. TaxID=2022749 RepID=UPI003D0AE90D
MTKLRIFLISLFIVLFSACGGDNSLGGSTTSSETNNTVVIDGEYTLNFLNGVSTQELTTNSETTNITVLAFDSDNTPLQSGTVKVAYPAKATLGVDVGTFAALSVAIADGKAVFQYTAPEDLQARVDAGDTSTTFGFYLSDDSSVSNSFTVTYSPETNQTVIKSYELTQSLSVSEYSMPLESTIQTAFTVRDDNGDAVADADVTTMTITLKNALLADLISKSNVTGDTLTFSGKNGETVNLKSNTRSGIVPIQVDTTFIDSNGDEQNLSEIFNMTILSGPPTAMSVSYVGTTHDSTNSKFIDTMVISITDKYFNPVNTQPAAAGYLIAGYTRETASDITTRIQFTPSDSEAGTLDPVAKTFTPNGVDLSNVSPANDILFTYGNGYVYNVSGKWGIDSVNVDVLNLDDETNASSSVSGLGFAIGHNYRNDTCRDYTGESVGNIVMLSDKFDTSGNVKAEIYFDYYLVGKSVMVGIDTLGYTAENNSTTKFGEAVRHTLRSTGLTSSVCTVPPNTTTPKTCTVLVHIDDTDQYLRNAYFGYDIVTTGEVAVGSYIASTNDNIHDCSAHNGVAYVTYYVTNPDPDAAGTFYIEDFSYGGEF